jgi:hypothetical protein
MGAQSIRYTQFLDLTARQWHSASSTFIASGYTGSKTTSIALQQK